MKDNVADKQCCSMAVSSIIYSKLQPLPSWNATVMNAVLEEGDILHRTVAAKFRPESLISNGYLDVRHFDDFKRKIDIFQQSFALQYDAFTKIYGFLQDEKNKTGSSLELIEGLRNLFSKHSAGVLVSRPKCFAVFKENDNSFYFFDSHSCEFDGNPTFADGKSCLIRCSTIEELHQICKRQIGVINQRCQYALEYIEVSKLTSALDHSNVVFADFHQGNAIKFPQNAGTQCCAMSVGSVIYAAVSHSPIGWNTRNLNEILTESHELYRSVRQLNEGRGNRSIAANGGYLLVDEFDVIANGFSLFNKNMTITFSTEAANNRIVENGSIRDSENTPGLSKTVTQGLTELFENHSAGIFICNNRAVAVMHYVSYFLFDPHSCNINGLAGEDGKAGLFKCNSLEELALMCKRQSGINIEECSANSLQLIYTLDFVDVQLHEPRKNNIQYISIQSEQSRNQVEQQHLNASKRQNVGDLRQQNRIEDMSVPFNYRQKENRNHRTSDRFANFGDLDSVDFNNIPMGTSLMAPTDMRQPLIGTMLRGVNNEIDKESNLLEITRKRQDNIVKTNHELKAEELAFFHLFPDGKNGQKQEFRPVSITTLDYFQTRIMGKDPRFQGNDYLFYALSMFEHDAALRTINVCGKKVQHKNDVVKNIHFYMKKIRGSQAYWLDTFFDLTSQIRCLGPPNYFITLSCNDLHWIDMRQALLKAEKDFETDPASMSVIQTQKLLEKHPVAASRHFMVRVNTIVSLLKSDASILGGKMIDHFWRIEYQNRGSPHLHMLAWVENTPDIHTPEGIARINEVITCELPEDPVERAKIEKCQRHHCTDTCKKYNTGICRFNYPRQVSSETRIVAKDSTACIRNGGRICLLKRASNEIFINNYNKKIFDIWGGNMDIQVCGGDEDIAEYLCKYCTKNEPIGVTKNLRDALKTIREENIPIGQKLVKQAYQIQRMRNVSAMEAAQRLCHLPFKQSSRECVKLPTHRPEERYSVIRFQRQNAVDFCQSIIDRYMQRPLQHSEYNFDQMSLMQFAMLFKPYYKTSTNEDEEGDEDVFEDEIIEKIVSRYLTLQNNQKMKIRTRPAVVRVNSFNLNQDPEGFYYSLLLQYIPFRNEDELTANFETAREAFLAKETILMQTSRELMIYRQRDRFLENAINLAKAYNPLLAEIDYNDNYQNDVSEEDEPDNRPDRNQFDADIKRMTVEQADLLNFVTECIRKQKEEKSLDRVRIFVTGGAGTGKTFTLKNLLEQIRRCYEGEKSAVKFGALTGVAAKLISGMTLHSLFRLPIQEDGKIKKLSNLTGLFLESMRHQWRNTKFLIIDEISMVPYEMLRDIHSRLQQIFDNGELFGGINVIVFGDLMQLPPVRGNPVYRQPESDNASTHLWRTFSFCELTRNMRQKGDNVFIDLLNALRVGALRSDQLNILMKKVENKPSGKFAVGEAIRIDPTNALVRQHNDEAIKLFRKKGVQMFVVEAQDQILDSKKVYTDEEIEKKIPNDPNKTGGFPKTLTIFEGAKVMLRSNLSTTKGLVNGARGVVTAIIWPGSRRGQIYARDLPQVRVKFDDIEEPQLISPQFTDINIKLATGNAKRRMLPLISCYASTIHKLQGSSVDAAVLNLGQAIFLKGQCYVALSRVRSLDGVMIEDIDPHKLIGNTNCNTEALREMFRLRQLPNYRQQNA